MKPISTLILTVKYFLQGDSWAQAFEFAKAIVYGFKS
jgi:hypothetical protein